MTTATTEPATTNDADGETTRPQAWIDLEAEIMTIVEEHPEAFASIPLNPLDEWGI